MPPNIDSRTTSEQPFDRVRDIAEIGHGCTKKPRGVIRVRVIRIVEVDPSLFEHLYQFQVVGSDCIPHKKPKSNIVKCNIFHGCKQTPAIMVMEILLPRAFKVRDFGVCQHLRVSTIQRAIEIRRQIT